MGKRERSNSKTSDKKRQKVDKYDDQQPEAEEEEFEQSSATGVEENGLTIGDMAWAHIIGYPWWPCKVYRVVKDVALVCFFGSDEKNRWAWVSRKQIKSFDSLTPDKVTKKQTGKILRSLRKAIEEAEEEVERRRKYKDNDSENEDTCVVCNLGGLLVLCDGCPCAYHCECVHPKLDAVPTGSWFCPSCADLDPLKARQSYPEDLNIQISKTKKLSKNSDKKSADSNDITTTTSTSTCSTTSKSHVNANTNSNKKKAKKKKSTGITNKWDLEFVRPPDAITQILQRDYWHTGLTNCMHEFNEYSKKYTSESRRNLASMPCCEEFERECKTIIGKLPSSSVRSNNHGKKGATKSQSDGSRKAANQTSLPSNTQPDYISELIKKICARSSTTTAMPNNSLSKPMMSPISPSVHSNFALGYSSFAPTSPTTASMTPNFGSFSTPHPHLAGIIPHLKGCPPQSSAKLPDSHYYSNSKQPDDVHEICLRYKYISEPDSSYRLIKKWVTRTPQLDLLSLNMDGIKLFLQQDNVPAHYIDEIRYFCFEERGWCSLCTTHAFTVNLSQPRTVVKLLLSLDPRYFPNIGMNMNMSMSTAYDHMMSPPLSVAPPLRKVVGNNFTSLLA